MNERVNKNMKVIKYNDRSMSAKKALYSVYKHSAKYRGYSFKVNFDEFIILVQQNCFYCDEKPIQVSKSKKSIFMYNGLDRIDNNKGYELINLRTCCKKCNRAKGERNDKDFFSWVDRCYHYICQKQ
jgi:hypothetical protein